MIDHDHVHTLALQRGDFRDRRRAAIHRDEQPRRILRDAARHAIRAQAVAFIRPQRQEARGFRAIGPQHAGEQRERGDAVHIVVAVEDDFFAAVERGENARHRRVHIRQRKRIAQLLQPRIEKALRLLHRTDAAVQQHLGHEPCEPGVFYQPPDGGGVGRFGQNPAAGRHGRILRGSRRRAQSPSAVFPKSRPTRARWL